ncbi:hypothetical protein ABPG75_012858 [Micractinium tetrahymenae]
MPGQQGEAALGARLERDEAARAVVATARQLAPGRRRLTLIASDGSPLLVPDPFFAAFEGGNNDGEEELFERRWKAWAGLPYSLKECKQGDMQVVRGAVLLQRPHGGGIVVVRYKDKVKHSGQVNVDAAAVDALLPHTASQRSRAEEQLAAAGRTDKVRQQVVVACAWNLDGRRPVPLSCDLEIERRPGGTAVLHNVFQVLCTNGDATQKGLGSWLALAPLVPGVLAAWVYPAKDVPKEIRRRLRKANAVPAPPPPPAADTSTGQQAGQQAPKSATAAAAAAASAGEPAGRQGGRVQRPPQAQQQAAPLAPAPAAEPTWEGFQPQMRGHIVLPRMGSQWRLEAGPAGTATTDGCRYAALQLTATILQSSSASVPAQVLSGFFELAGSNEVVFVYPPGSMRACGEVAQGAQPVHLKFRRSLNGSVLVSSLNRLVWAERRQPKPAAGSWLALAFNDEGHLAAHIYPPSSQEAQLLLNYLRSNSAKRRQQQGSAGLPKRQRHAEQEEEGEEAAEEEEGREEEEVEAGTAQQRQRQQQQQQQQQQPPPQTVRHLQNPQHNLQHQQAGGQAQQLAAPCAPLASQQDVAPVTPARQEQRQRQPEGQPQAGGSQHGLQLQAGWGPGAGQQQQPAEEQASQQQQQPPQETGQQLAAAAAAGLDDPAAAAGGGPPLPLPLSPGGSRQVAVLSQYLQQQLARGQMPVEAAMAAAVLGLLRPGMPSTAAQAAGRHAGQGNAAQARRGRGRGEEDESIDIENTENETDDEDEETEGIEREYTEAAADEMAGDEEEGSDE